MRSGKAAIAVTTVLLALELASSRRVDLDSSNLLNASNAEFNGEHVGQNDNDCHVDGETIKREENKAKCGRVGIEVEFNDGLIHREATPQCNHLLDYGEEWFRTEMTYNVSSNWGSGAKVPLFNVESEVRNRDTIEVATGPSVSTEGVMKGLDRVAMLARLLKGARKMTLELMAANFAKLTQKKMALSMGAQFCGQGVTISSNGGGANMLAGVQVNFETKISKVLDIARPESRNGIVAVLGTGGLQYWDNAWQCLDSLVPELKNHHKRLTNAHQGAYLIAILFMAKTAECERDNRVAISCKIGLDILPKVSIEQLQRLTEKSWQELGALMDTKRQCKNHVPKTWNPDEHMFPAVKKPLGLGKNLWDKLDSYVVVELRGASGKINSEIKSYLTGRENGRQGNVDIRRWIACLQRWAMRGYPFQHTQECSLNML